MSITRDVTLTVNGSRSTLDSNIYMYMNDGGITLNIKILNLAYIINSLTSPVRIASATVLKPNGNGSFTVTNLKVDGDKVIFDIESNMTDEINEVGIYRVQIHLYDDAENRVTIPPFKFYVKPVIGGSGGGSTPSGGKDNSIAVNGKIYVANSEGLITLPDYPTVPSKTSELINDSNFATTSYVTEKISEYQKINDSNLQTEDKTIVGAINEVKSNVDSKVDISEVNVSIASYVEEHKSELKGEKGDPGPQGIQGESAYVVAKNEGFTGTVNEWLESLKGADGNVELGENITVTDLEAKVPKWVSIKDRLPDKESMLCLVISDGDLYVSHWHWSGGGAWFFTDGEYDCNVTHWAKAPELPKEEEAMLTEQFIANK